MSISAEFQGLLRFDTIAIILAGATLSNAVDLHGTSIVGISIPSNFSGTSLTILSALSLAGTYQGVRNVDNTAATFTCQASSNIAFVPFDLASIRYLKLQSNVAQATDLEITLITRPI